MAVRTRAREVETVLPKVVERKADYQRSGDVASEHNGTRIRLERLPQLLNDPDFVKSIEGTESYKRNGYTWFWTDTVGTNLSGYYKINPQGKTLDEMFTFISKEFDSKVQAVPFNERAYFYKGNQPLSVAVGGSDVYGRRLFVDGDGRLVSVAPVVVVEQYGLSQAQDSVLHAAAQTSKQLQSGLKDVARSVAQAQEVVSRIVESGLMNKNDVKKLLQALVRDASKLSKIS
ncbi:MAG: hypothetical protein KGH64_01900 [Candidatus Micrarchaeota archaeon]|nr:hypothetical protein [Candidatus Micrarchaeota archaeon]MDE1834069.1 hypothetical protein [Candidatus Micrarchaeota archaeon]MDE1859669.1 hypothetical protein [Candidatus Micrarchaeota archaeon]